MNKPTPHRVNLIKDQPEATESRAHRQFNKLIKKIGEQKKLLAAWIETESTYRNKATQYLHPQQLKANGLRADMVRRLDRACDHPLFKKRDRVKLTHIIVTLSRELIEHYGMDELKPIYDRRNDIAYDTEQSEYEATDSEEMRTVFESNFGVPLDEDMDFSSPGAFDAAFGSQIQDMEDAQAVREWKRASRPKSAKQVEKENQREAARQRIRQSIQAIYRKLVTALHPDREPDPVKRERKTELMQAVNVAYENRDLLQLMELQLSLEQVDHDPLAALSEDRIQHYNAVLREQSARLERELSVISSQIRMQLQIIPDTAIGPADVIKHLDAEIKRWKKYVDHLKDDLEVLSDMRTLRAWLKEYRIPR